MSTNLANNLKYLRTLHNYSQDELAKQLYVSHQTISNHETGKSQPDSRYNPCLRQILRCKLSRFDPHRSF